MSWTAQQYSYFNPYKEGQENIHFNLLQMARYQPALFRAYDQTGFKRHLKIMAQQKEAQLKLGYDEQQAQSWINIAVEKINNSELGMTGEPQYANQLRYKEYQSQGNPIRAEAIGRGQFQIQAGGKKIGKRRRRRGPVRRYRRR